MVEVRKMSVLKGVFCLALGLCAWTVRAQERAAVPGMEKNAQYQTLLEQEKQLHHVQDSVVGLMETVRKAYATDTAGRQQYAQQILDLENELYDVRNRIGVVVNSISSMEQEYIISSMNDTPASQPSGTATSVPAAAATGTVPATSAASAQPAAQPQARQSSNLVYNPYFKEHLSAADYGALMTSQQQETAPLEIIANYIVNYKVMDSLSRIYETGERAVAEDAYTKLQTLFSINERLSDSLSHVWGYIFDNKTYIYNYLLDKMNKSDLLAGFERQFRTMNQRIASARDTVVSEAVYAYPLRKKLILDYEHTLASLLGYTQARDSIATVQRSVSTLDFALPGIDPAPRNFIDYSEIKRSVPSIYNAQNPIPEAEIFRYGTVYRIQLGIFQRAQPVSIFRNVNPLSYDKLDDGRYRYCAGGFRELAEAQTALEAMKKLGFRQPKIVVWRDGVFDPMDDASASSSNKIGTVYRIEIAGEGDVMSDRVKEVIETAVPGKEISRATDEQGNYIYTVGTFDSRETAEDLVARLSGLDGISAKILTIEP